MDRKNRKGSRLLLVLLWCVLSMLPQYALAMGDFACHVVLKNGESKVFLVQTEKPKIAREAAMRASFTVERGRKSPVVKVEECIKADKGRFSDSTLQKTFKDMPL